MNCSVVARPPGLVCAHTPVAVNRVESLGDLDIVKGECPGKRGKAVVDNVKLRSGKLNDSMILKSWWTRVGRGDFRPLLR